MLDDNQVKTVWTARYEAEIRSLYFADLATRYTRRKPSRAEYVQLFKTSYHAVRELGAYSSHRLSAELTTGAMRLSTGA